MASYVDAYLRDTQRQKLRKWGIMKDEAESSQVFLQQVVYQFFNQAPRTEPWDEGVRLRELERRVEELEKRVPGRRQLIKADHIYLRFQEELEKNQFGKIVAIDSESEEIVGVGNDILEAYNEAKKKTGKTQFDFKRVGYPYIHRV
jgi:hypothetical protein